MKSRLLLYAFLLPGLAIPWAAMIWYPDAYTIAFRFVQDNPILVLVVAVATCALCWKQAHRTVPSAFRRKFSAFVILVGLVAIGYISINFTSVAIAEAMVFNGLAVYLVAMLITSYVPKRDT